MSEAQKVSRFEGNWEKLFHFPHQADEGPPTCWQGGVTASCWAGEGPVQGVQAESMPWMGFAMGGAHALPPQKVTHA